MSSFSAAAASNGSDSASTWKAKGTQPGAMSAAGASQSIEIVPTPIVPYASALVQRGQLFSPAAVANVPRAPQVLPPSTIGLTPTDVSGTVLGGGVLNNTAPKITTVGPMVPVNLPAEEKALLEKALRKDSPSEKPAATPTAANEKRSDKKIETKAVGDEQPPKKGEASPATDSVARIEKKISNGSTDVEGEEIESGARAMKPVDEMRSAAKSESTSEAAKIVPLPPLEHEEPSRGAVPVNLPQPPIPLEFPRTGS